MGRPHNYPPGMVPTYEFPDNTSPFVVEDFVNKNLEDIIKKYLNEIHEIGVDEEVGENIDGKRRCNIHRG